MKHPFLKRSICLLLAVLSVLAMPAAALEGVSDAEEAQTAGSQEAAASDPFDLPEETEETQETEDENLPAVEVPTVFVDEQGSYLAPEELAVYVMRHMQETSLSNPSQAEERYTGVVAFYDYSVTSEKDRLEHPYFFYYEKGELQDEQPEFVTAKGYLDLTEAPVADSSVNSSLRPEEDKLVYVAEERYVDEQAEEHAAFLFAFNRSDEDNGLYTGTYEEENYTDGLPAVTEEAAEPEEQENQPAEQAAAPEEQENQPAEQAAAPEKQENQPAEQAAAPEEQETQPVKPARAPAKAPAAAADQAEQSNDSQQVQQQVPQTVPAVTIQAAPTGIRVSWGKDAYAAGFRVYRRIGNGAWSKIADITSGSTTYYLDTGVTGGKSYSYTVRAFYGQVAKGTKDPFANGVLSGFAASNRVYYIPAPEFQVSGGEKEITVTWSKVAGADHYSVFRSTNGGRWTQLVQVDGSELSYEDQSGKSGVRYHYTVRADSVSQKANSSYYDFRKDDTQAVFLRSAPVVTVKAMGSEGIQISWKKDANATGYRVYRKVPGSSWAVLTNITSAATTTYLDAGVKDGQNYTYTVRAYYGDVKKIGSASVSVTNLWSGASNVALTYVKMPRITGAYSDNEYMKVQWSAVSGATGYVLYVRSSTSQAWKQLSVVKGSTSYQHKSARNGETYYYTVKAFKTDSKGVNYYSDYVDNATQYVYHAPLQTTVKIVADGNQVTWNLDSRATGYRIYRKSGNQVAAIKNVTAQSLGSGAKTGSFLDPASGLTSGQVYSYTVRAYYGSRSVSAASVGQNNDWGGYVYCKVVYLATPAVNAKAENDPTGLKIKWNPVTGAKGYYIYRRSASGSWRRVGTAAGGSTNAYIDTTATKLPSGTVCYYTVCAYYDSKLPDSYFDTDGAYAVYLPKPADASVSAPLSNGTTITWTAVSGASLYEVYRRPQTGSTWTLLSAVSGTSYVDASAKNGSPHYTYTIRPQTTATVNGQELTILGDFERDGYRSGIAWSGSERNTWINKDGNIYYVDKYGTLLTGWQYLTRNGRQCKYYFDENTGKLVTNMYSYFGIQYRDMKCRIEVAINTQSKSNPSYLTIYLYDQSTDSYCIPALSIPCIGHPTRTRTTTSGYLRAGSGKRWLDSGGSQEQYATFIRGTNSWFHSCLFRTQSVHSFLSSTYNSMINNVNNSGACIRMQSIYAYLIQDIMKHGYGSSHNVPVFIYKNTSQPGPFGVPQVDKISSRNTDPTDPAITGKFYYNTTVQGISATAGAKEWTYY